MNRRYFSSTLNLLHQIRNKKGKRIIHIFDQQDTKVEKQKRDQAK